jgi:hypothetical protein
VLYRRGRFKAGIMMVQAASLLERKSSIFKPSATNSSASLTKVSQPASSRASCCARLCARRTPSFCVHLHVHLCADRPRGSVGG